MKRRFVQCLAFAWHWYWSVCLGSVYRAVIFVPLVWGGGIQFVVINNANWQDVFARLAGALLGTALVVSLAGFALGGPRQDGRMLTALEWLRMPWLRAWCDRRPRSRIVKWVVYMLAGGYDEALAKFGDMWGDS